LQSENIKAQISFLNTFFKIEIKALKYITNGMKNVKIDRDSISIKKIRSHKKNRVTNKL